jgi:fatty-acyl-CoA synthase
MSVIARLVSEVVYLNAAIRMLRRVTPIARRKDFTFPDAVEQWAQDYGDRTALLANAETLSFAELDARANRYARWAAANGVTKGDCVCLLMPNRTEYLAIWVGIARMGGVTALLNTNQTGKALAFSINIVEPKHIIVDASLAEAFRSAEPDLTGTLTRWSYGPGGDGKRVDEVVASLSDAPIPKDERPPLNLNDKCIYIYTSGTTGLPKAANVNHYRVQVASNGFSAAMNAKPDDRVYISLPLYHSSACLVGLGSLLSVGGSAFIAERFSASRFWDDVVDHDCTIFQYVGELCRYLVNAPPHPKETQHHIRLCAGNGLRPDIWRQFQNRFKINHILEYYAATEGNVAIFNFDSKLGSVGRIATLAKRRFPYQLVRFDVDAGLPVRGSGGFCIHCRPDEVGELVAEIVDDPLKPAQRFEGYADPEATRRKILRDVFKPGDMWFRTGDLLRKDRDGYYYFVDRVGDTFRWKGENVATSEVAEVINLLPAVRESVAYGVAVPGYEGKAGMAAIVTGDELDLVELRRHMRDHLPSYARPRFVRMCGELDITSTLKQRRIAYMAEGFDPAGIDDPLYFDDPDRQELVPLDRVLFDKIVGGEIPL